MRKSIIGFVISTVIGGVAACAYTHAQATVTDKPVPRGQAVPAPSAPKVYQVACDEQRRSLRHRRIRSKGGIPTAMAEHYTRNTESVLAWCNTCQRDTKHIVSSGRRGRCMEHDAPLESKKQIQARERREREAKSPKLFS